MVVSMPLPLGVTFPPIDLKNIIDKTVEFVNKGGVTFETTIIQKEKDNPTFGFIKPGHPFHPYYKHKLAELKAASAAAAPAVPTEGGEQKPIVAAPTVSKAAPKPVKPKTVEPPPPLEFYLNLPDISAQELDIMRLTAQFVARNGQQFHHGLLNRENRNPQFDFLKHNHPLNIIFAALVNCYSKVLLPPRDVLDKLRSPIYRDKSTMLEKAVSHMEWEQVQERARKKAEEEEDQERMAMALIDWHDFVVVETIEFFDDEADLPAPATYEQLIAGAIPAPEEVKTVEEEMETDEMEMEDENKTSAEDAMEEEPVQEGPAPAPAGRVPPVIAAPVRPASPPPRPKSPEPEMQQYLPPPGTTLKILSAPIKRAEPKKNTMMMLCPSCNMMIPQNEYSEHLRIELLDPKFAEQRKQQEARKKDTSLLGNEEISKNLVAFTKYRTDIFGTSETEIGKAIGEEEDNRPAVEKVTWDGHSGSIGRTTTAAMAGITITDQISAIHASKGLTPGGTEDKPSIGPQAVHQHPGLVPPRQPIITVVGGTPSSSVPRPVIAPAVPGVLPPPLMSMPMPYGMHPGMMMPPGMAGMYPQMGLPPGMHPPPPPDDEPSSKRQKMEEQNLIPEEKFLADYPSPVTLIVQVPPTVPGDKNEWNFQAQQLEFTLPPTATIAMVKDKVKEALGMPPNKQKLKGPHTSILKDTSSLAYYNVVPGTVLVLGIKERGGRKK